MRKPTLQQPCPDCRGKGKYTRFYLCRQCGGRGILLNEYRMPAICLNIECRSGAVKVQEACGRCQGTGWV